MGQVKMAEKSKQNESERGNKWTTICLDREFKHELEKQMSYGDSFQSFLKSELEINKED